jgi:hypothetical protein
MECVKLSPPTTNDRRPITANPLPPNKARSRPVSANGMESLMNSRQQSMVPLSLPDVNDNYNEEVVSKAIGKHQPHCALKDFTATAWK